MNLRSAWQLLPLQQPAGGAPAPTAARGGCSRLNIILAYFELCVLHQRTHALLPVHCSSTMRTSLSPQCALQCCCFRIAHVATCRCCLPTPLTPTWYPLANTTCAPFCHSTHRIAESIDDWTVIHMLTRLLRPSLLLSTAAVQVLVADPYGSHCHLHCNTCVHVNLSHVHSVHLKYLIAAIAVVFLAPRRCALLTPLARTCHPLASTTCG
jgi:hypothetical protein